MKKLLLPLILAVLGGLASASAASIVSAKKAATAYAVFVADSAAKHVKDSTIVADSLAKELKAAATEEAAAAAAASEFMTPADSIRDAQTHSTSLKAATKGLSNATDATRSAPVDPKRAVNAATSHASAPISHDVIPTASGKVITPRTADVPRPVPGKVPEAVESGLPENRIAKIFGAMQSKEAAKVLEQMSDSDVRVILGKMGDKQAAAILVAFPAARAAAISKGESARPELHKNETSKTDSTKKPSGDHK